MCHRILSFCFYRTFRIGVTNALRYAYPPLSNSPIRTTRNSRRFIFDDSETQNRHRRTNGIQTLRHRRKYPAVHTPMIGHDVSVCRPMQLYRMNPVKAWIPIGIEHHILANLRKLPSVIPLIIKAVLSAEPEQCPRTGSPQSAEPQSDAGTDLCNFGKWHRGSE